jgi:acyl-coenzyme A synthetase/AMP-(fatty) acid ligase
MYQTDQLINFWADIKPKELAFVDEDHEVTFRELNMFTRKIAFVLDEKGVKQGDLVAIILPTYLGWLTTLSLYRLGVSTLSQNNLNPFSSQANPDWVISLEPHPGISEARTIIIDDASLEKINSSKEMTNPPGFNSPDVLATLFATSGTTGEVKYIAPTAEELRVIATRPGTNDSFGEDGVLSRLMFGASWAHFHALKCLNLGKTYYSCIFTDYRLPKFVSKYPIRTLIGSPAQISSFLDIQAQTATKLPLLKTVIMGGSVPSPQIVSRIKSQIDCNLFNTYGSTEAGHIAIYQIDDSDVPAFSIRPPVTLEIVDENDCPLPSGEVGTIRYTRPDMSHSYYKNPAATAEFFKDGFFYPGDSGHLDSSGRLILNGRTNEVINLGGAKLNPEIIDRIAISQLGVVDCAAFAVPGLADIDQLALALVVDGDFDREFFEKAIMKKSPHSIAIIVLTEKIARNENGKVLRSALSKQYLDSLD